MDVQVHGSDYRWWKYACAWLTRGATIAGAHVHVHGTDRRVNRWCMDACDMRSGRRWCMDASMRVYTYEATGAGLDKDAYSKKHSI